MCTVHECWLYTTYETLSTRGARRAQHTYLCRTQDHHTLFQVGAQNTPSVHRRGQIDIIIIRDDATATLIVQRYTVSPGRPANGAFWVHGTNWGRGSSSGGGDHVTAEVPPPVEGVTSDDTELESVKKSITSQEFERHCETRVFHGCRSPNFSPFPEDKFQ